MFKYFTGKRSSVENNVNNRKIKCVVLITQERKSIIDSIGKITHKVHKESFAFQ